MTRTPLSDVLFKAALRSHDFKDIEFLQENNGNVTLIFTPMGCHGRHCQIRWDLTREEFIRMGKTLFSIETVE